jgi:hypothetical protein
MQYRGRETCDPAWQKRCESKPPKRQ